jgi:pilus assembly protein FimV
MKYRSMLLASAALQAGIANGMGLGNIDVQSYLGAPLQAQIALLSPREYGESDIKISLAKLEVYDRFDARYEAHHGDLRFNTAVSPSGQIAIQITSGKRIVEPFLDIVVELSWPEGTTYRRYNLLLDPPNYAASRQSHTPIVAAPAIQTKTQAVMEKQQVADIALESRYQVRSGDSLWKLAKRARKGTNLSIQSMMDVLYAANPNAFINGKRDKLKLGSMLSMPTAQDRVDATLNADVSLRQLDNQSYPIGAADVAFGLPDEALEQGAMPTPVPVVLPAADAMVTIENIDTLKAQLAALQQEKAELQRFQTQVREEIQLLQRQREAMKSTIALAQDITSEIEQSVEADTVKAQPVLPASETIVSEKSRAVAQDLIGGTIDDPNTLIEKSGPGFWYLLAMVPMGVLIVLLGMRARRVQEIKRTDDVRDEDLYELVFGTKRDRTKSDSPDQVQKAIHKIKEKAGHQESAPTQAGSIDQQDASKDDANQMIELYILYNQYQKALNVILTEISKRPARKDLRLYLMQVYAKMENWDAFDDQMEILHQMGDELLIKAAMELGEQREAYAELHRDAS